MCVCACARTAILARVLVSFLIPSVLPAIEAEGRQVVEEEDVRRVMQHAKRNENKK